MIIFQFFLQVKDESIVRLTNQLHENELRNVIESSAPPTPAIIKPSLNTPVFNFIQKQSIQRTNSNGISFDSDRGEFKEFVDVGVQTSDKSSTVSNLFT